MSPVTLLLSVSDFVLNVIKPDKEPTEEGLEPERSGITILALSHMSHQLSHIIVVFKMVNILKVLVRRYIYMYVVGDTINFKKVAGSNPAQINFSLFIPKFI